MDDPLLTVRRFLEPRWAQFKIARGLHPNRPTSFGMCRLAAGFLGRYLEVADSFCVGGPTWRESGKKGGYFGLGGFEAPASFVPENPHIRDRWQHHAWLEIEGIIVDLTADQFDPDIPPVLLAASDSRYVANATRIERQSAWLGGAYTTDVAVWLSEAEPLLPPRSEILQAVAVAAPALTPLR